MRRPLLVIALLLVALAALPASAQARRGACVVGVPGPGCEVWTGKVVSVNDGDTMDVDVVGEGRRRIRLTGIQAMELNVYSSRHRAGDCHAVEAAQRLERLVRRSRGLVRLAAEDPESMSRGRLVRTVAVQQRGRWRDVGTIMLNEGRALWWGSWAESAVNGRYSVLVQQSIAAGRGLFDSDGCGAGPSAASPLKLWVNWDADGDDTTNPSGEWVRIRNLDPVNPVPLGGWYVRNAGLRRYAFPAHAVIAPAGVVTVDVGREGDDQTEFPWGLPHAVFVNASHDEDAMGDGAYLFDPLGNIRASMVYPCRVACSDPLEGSVEVSADPRGRREAVTISNRTAGAIDLDGYILKSPPQSYHFGAGSVLPPGGSMRVRIIGAPEEDEPLDRSWGFARPILRDAGDLVKVVTYTDITLACAAWGDRSC